MELCDWQTQCSTLAHAETGTLSHRLRRMMPTVGCEADAVAFTKDTTVLWSAGWVRCTILAKQPAQL